MLLVALTMFSCYEEDDITAELRPYKRNYDINSSDPVEVYSAKYFNNYKKYFITDPDSSDYTFNFGDKNKVVLEKSERDSKTMMEAVNLVDKLIVSLYKDDFIKNNFPFDFILAETIFDKTYETYETVFSSTNFFAVSMNYLDTLKQENYVAQSALLNGRLLMHVYEVSNGFTLSDNFFKYAEQWYGERYDKNNWNREKLYEIGILEVMEGYWFSTFPKKNEDIEQWIVFIINSSDEQIKEFTDKYPAMKEKFEVISTALSKSLGQDYRTLRLKL